MFKMKSERPLLVNNIPQTEFETTEQHGKELIRSGLAVRVDEQPEQPEQSAPREAVTTEVATKMAGDVQNKMDEPAINKTVRATKQK